MIMATIARPANGASSISGAAPSAFGGRKDARPVLTADGYALQQRDRLSIALLNQISGEYVGKFLDNALTVQIGIRAVLQA